MRLLIAILASILFLSATNAEQFVLKSPAYTNHRRVPMIYTCDSQNMQPPELDWENPPAGTKSFALIYYTPDAPWGTVYLWDVFNIPADTKKIPEGGTLPETTIVGMNSRDENIYRGPCPTDSNLHHYIYDLYALDTTLDLDETATTENILAAMKNHILAQTQFDSLYSH
jgi:Raf kinase inhibitor-like YbhB/YbcL family protein